MKILETERLLLRQIHKDDYSDLFLMNSDPQIMRYVGDGSTRDQQQMGKELDMLISHYVRNQAPGIWATTLKNGNSFVGASGLVHYDNTTEVEVGYRFLKQYWNQGYATEASVGLLKYGFETLHLTKIVSSTHPDNIASRRVLEKIGMKYVDHRIQYGCEQAYYEIRAEDYRERYNKQD